MSYFRIKHLCVDGKALAFDVTPSHFVLLHHGTAELMKTFVADMGIDGVVEKWSVRHACSPYYADDDNAPHFRDRYKQFFRVEVSLAEPVAVALEPFKSWSSDGLDDTWHPPEAGSLYQWEELPCVVIANFFDEHAGGIDIGGGVRQQRFEMGSLKLDGTVEAIQSRVKQLYDAGGQLNHRIAYTRYLYHLKPR